MPHRRGLRASRGTAAKPACRATMCRLAFDAARCRVAVLPSARLAGAPGSGGGGAAARAASAPANAATAIGRARSSKTRWTAAPKAARSAVQCTALHARRHGDGQQSDTPDGTTRCTATCSESAAIMGGIQPDWMRDPDHGGCADRRNTGCRTTPGWSHSRGTVRRIRGRRHCRQDGGGRPQRSAGSTAAEGTPSMRRRGQCCTTPAARRRPRA